MVDSSRKLFTSNHKESNMLEEKLLHAFDDVFFFFFFGIISTSPLLFVAHNVIYMHKTLFCAQKVILCPQHTS